MPLDTKITPITGLISLSFLWFVWRLWAFTTHLKLHQNSFKVILCLVPCEIIFFKTIFYMVTDLLSPGFGHIVDFV